ncbi:hypothetical protein [Puniceicoccus vermicola]|uniref:Lipoprotein n=1 Tax=Puniceicoccus vermicola TaxID=388746 RepID=A0A7X1E4Q8_9BACT|nr:hypothetical protein [Puniceicoccus vermicola]MBC2602314.1 hypothetical protein [Puniceicoccus vermicola]
MNAILKLFGVVLAMASVSCSSERFIEGDFSSVGKDYDPQQTKAYEILGLTTMTYQYSVEPHHELEFAVELIDYLDKDSSREDVITARNDGSSPISGSFEIYYYINPLNGDTIIEVTNKPSRGNVVSQYFRLRSETYQKVRSARPALAFSSDPNLRWISENQAELLKFRGYGDNDGEDLILSLEITAELKSSSSESGGGEGVSSH